MERILVLTRPNDVEEITRVVKPYCNETEIASCDISGHRDMHKKYDLIISYSYAPIIKRDFIQHCACPIINVHPTLLPYGRGIYPLLWACINSEPFGATIHMIDSEEIDSGDVIKQKQIDIPEEMTLRQLREFLTLHARILLSEFLLEYDMNKTIIKTPQNELGKKQQYKNRRQSQEVFQKLTNGWDTKIKEIAMMNLK